MKTVDRVLEGDNINGEVVHKKPWHKKQLLRGRMRKAVRCWLKCQTGAPVITRHVLFLGFWILDTCLEKGCGDHMGGEEEGRLVDLVVRGLELPVRFWCHAFVMERPHTLVQKTDFQLTEVGTCARAVFFSCFHTAIVFVYLFSAFFFYSCFCLLGRYGDMVLPFLQCNHTVHGVSFGWITV